MTAAIEVSNVCVDYRLPTLTARSLKAMPGGARWGRIRHGRLRALDDVTLTVERGEVVAVLGANGAGKSTLIRVLGQVIRPTAGRVVVRGTVAPIMDLGAGFDLEATGLENAVLYGALLGRRPAEVAREAPAIVEWAGLVEYADVPVGAYSSGMMARLAFATATWGAPQVLLIDEVLAVGDAAFQRRSAERIRELADGGRTVVVVGHALQELEAIASRAVWLQAGQVRSEGAFDAVARAYLDATPQESVSRTVATP
jgi:ABC-type polysaccharide/polyol phosphate transport system ATPase subunit